MHLLLPILRRSRRSSGWRHGRAGYRRKNGSGGAPPEPCPGKSAAQGWVAGC